MSLEDDFFELFGGRLDAYGTDSGGCVRAPATGVLNWDHLIDGHLNGDKPIGVYPAESSDRCYWGCVDWDTPDALDHAKATQLALHYSAGVTGWIEQSRSKGYHLWVFPEEPVSMALMRYALMGACQVADASTKEVNPKQELLLDGQLGNYVRLPYPKMRTPGRQEMVLSGGHLRYGLEEFVEHALGSRASVDQLRKLQRLYRAPVLDLPPLPPVVPTTDAEHRMGGLAWTIYKDGPREGGDRSGALMALAGAMRRNGQLTYDEAFSLLANADERWGKYHGRPNAAQLLQQTMQKAGW